MKPIRLSDNVFRGLLTAVSRGIHPLAPDTFIEICILLNAEAKARDYKDWKDAELNFKYNSETAIVATPFDELVKERAIAIKGLRTIEKRAHKIHATDQHVPAQEVEDIAEEFCNMAHNTLDEIGDDRESELE